MADQRKINEALEHVQIAEKSLKTSLLKWKPDYEIAADEYSKAATCFRNAKAFEECKNNLMKASECHKQNRSIFHAAKCLDQAVIVCKELGDYQEMSLFAERSAKMYQQHGSCDAAASILDKAAKILEQYYPEQALFLLQKAVEVVMIEDNPRQASEYTSKISRLLVKLKQYDQAADSIRREIGLHQQNESFQATGRLVVSLVLVQLARGDIVAAEKAFKEWGNYCDAPEVQTLEMLLQAYDDEDTEEAQRALNSPFIKHMDVEYAILARDLPLPEGNPIKPPTNVVRENAAPSYVSSNASTSASPSKQNDENAEKPSSAQSPDDDEYEGGLC